MFQEHDMIQATQDFESEGYEVKEGMRGTIVSVHQMDTYIVEFPALGPGIVVAANGKTLKICAVPPKHFPGKTPDFGSDDFKEKLKEFYSQHWWIIR